MGTGLPQRWAGFAPFHRVRADWPEPPRPAQRILVLQLGDNPTTDYYLRPRLAASGLPWRIADLSVDPAAELAQPDGLWVILCRYANAPWLAALARVRSRLARLALMIDDDLSAMAIDPRLPRLYRAHVFAHHGRWAGRLSLVTGEIWASTPTLARRYGADAVLSPIPEADPPAPGPTEGAPRLVYPGGASHARERRFVLALARRVAKLRPEARFELIGVPGERVPANVDQVAEQPWPLYRAAQGGRRAAVVLAPLFASPVNAARAPVKAFDAARLGAAGLFADQAPFRGWVEGGVDGVLAPMDEGVWTEAIVGLVDDPARRLALAQAARARLIALRRDPSALPAPPAAP